MSESQEPVKPMVVPRHFGNLDVERRRSIIEVAFAEFVEHGFERASMNRIIGATGESKGSMYHFFESKADLFALTAWTVIERLEAHVGPPPTGHTSVAGFRDAFQGWYRSMLAFVADNRDDDALLEVLRAAMAGPNPPEPIQRCAAGIGAWYAALFDELAALGALRDDIPTDILAAATERATQAVDRWFIDEIRRRPERLDLMAEAGTDMFMRLVTP